jgi:polysaccharide biosynthesis/export protein
MGCPMRGVRAVILCLLTVLALSGCMRGSAPVAVAQPQAGLDAVAYGPPYGMAPAPTAAAYAAAPMPAAHDAAYRLDAGDRLRRGYIREPSVAVEIETYRPFFILGEVAAPGQYTYVPHMSVETAVAIAGGFSPRTLRDRVTLTDTDHSGPSRVVVPLGTALGPGNTVLVGERWF